ncbi:MAG: hypothetical protein ACREC6_12230, partial [Hyphomicrobiaceae bacterium]
TTRCVSRPSPHIVRQGRVDPAVSSKTEWARMLNGQGGHAPAGQGLQREGPVTGGSSEATTHRLIDELKDLLQEAPQPPLSPQTQQSGQAPHGLQTGLSSSSPPPPLPAALLGRAEDSASPGPLPTAPPPPSGAVDEEPAVPIPSSWLDTMPEPPRPAGRLSDQMRAALFGFAVGTAVVVPAVLALTGKFGPMPWSDPPAVKSQTPTAPTVAARTKAPGSEDPSRSRSLASKEGADAKPGQVKGESPRAAAAAPSPGFVPDPIRSLISDAQRHIAAGNIPIAREVLSRAMASGTSDAALAASLAVTLAETYDPNMLAAWNVRNVKADTETARKLYRKASEGGLEKEKTRLRLDALQ